MRLIQYLALILITILLALFTFNNIKDSITGSYEKTAKEITKARTR